MRQAPRRLVVFHGFDKMPARPGNGNAKIVMVFTTDFFQMFDDDGKQGHGIFQVAHDINGSTSNSPFNLK